MSAGSSRSVHPAVSAVPLPMINEDRCGSAGHCTGPQKLDSFYTHQRCEENYGLSTQADFSLILSRRTYLLKIMNLDQNLSTSVPVCTGHWAGGGGGGGQ